MNSPAWQLTAPLDALVFDCDATLSEIEGINYLAELNQVEELVGELTEQAMSQTGITPTLYDKRLSLVKPTREQVIQLAGDYFLQRAPGVEASLDILKRLGKTIYLFSAGVNPAVQLFGQQIGFKSENIYAVDLQFNEAGAYIDFDRQSPLTTTDGKKVLMQKLLAEHARIGYVGDGMNDAAVIGLVTRFVGYGGVCYRENVRDLSDFYVTARSFLPLLPLWLTEQEMDSLTEQEKTIVTQGLELLKRGSYASKSS